jgi:hemin uptake protein HemP
MTPRLPKPDAASADDGAASPSLQSHALLGGGRTRIIEHAGERYVLRLTRNGKLILSK